MTKRDTRTRIPRAEKGIDDFIRRAHDLADLDVEEPVAESAFEVAVGFGLVR